MKFAVCCLVLFLIPSLVNGADLPGVWLPRVATTKQVTRDVVKGATGACTGGTCQVQKSTVVKKETWNRVWRFRLR